MIRSTDSHTGTDAPLDPKVAEELEALDAALRGEAIDDDALASLVRDVRAQAPVMPAELRTQLRDDVAAGFPRRGAAGAFQKVVGGGAAGAAPSTRKRRSFAFGGGLAVGAVFAVFVAGVALQQGGSNDMTTVSQIDSLPAPHSDSSAARSSAAARSSGAAGDNVERSRLSRDAATPPGSEASAAYTTPSSVAPERLPSTGGSADGAAAPSVDRAASRLEAFSNTSTPASGKRRVEQAVDLSVRVRSGKLSDAVGKVNDITRGAGGFVADSQVSTRTRGAGNATFTLQVASSKLDQAIDRLSDLGTVTRQTQQSTDITSSFDSANQRLRDAKAVRRALLRSLDKADSAGEIAALRARIADNRGTISGLESDILRLERRTNLTTIALSLRAPSGDAADTEDDGQWSVGDAAGDALDILGAVTGVLLVGAAALLPFAIIVAIGWAVYRVRRRRGRDAALDD